MVPGFFVNDGLVDVFVGEVAVPLVIRFGPNIIQKSITRLY